MEKIFRHFLRGRDYIPTERQDEPMKFTSYNDIYGTIHDGFVFIKRDKVEDLIREKFHKEMSVYQSDLADMDFLITSNSGGHRSYRFTESIGVGSYKGRCKCYKINREHTRHLNPNGF